MKTLIVAGLCLAIVAGTAMADWQPGDPDKMHFPQRPDPCGWDVHFEDYYVADDFQCTESGPLTDIHLWISWEMDSIGDVNVNNWYIYIFGGDSGQPEYPILWQLLPPYDYEVVFAGAGSQGWLYPEMPPGFPDDHMLYFQVNITNIAQPFIQTQGQVYWLLIRAPVVMDYQFVGWKTSVDSFGSPALWLADVDSWLWLEVDVDFLDYVDMAFVVTNDVEYGACCLPTGDCVLERADNCYALGGLWQGGETVCEPNLCDPFFGACCVNTGDCVSDLMENACDALGGHWQGGETVCEPNLCEPFYCDSTWSDCPSADDWITNVTFNTINNDSGDECATESYGDYTHLSTEVSPGSTRTLSVTFESSGFTQYVRAWVDWNQDYDFNDPGEQYDLGSGASTTVSTDINVPADALLGPTRMRVTESWDGYAGPCENGMYGETEDYTVEVNDIQHIGKWVQLPDLSSAGMDVNATKPVMLGDDFECTQTGFVTEIGIWGSWLSDELPSGDANAVVFTLKIYSDDPCGALGYSEPNEPLWEKQLTPGEFEVVRYAEGLDEGWYEPDGSVYTPSADTVCWRYNFNFNECDAFFQRGTADEPIIYWLVVQAEPMEALKWFGWKNSIDYWNDAAVASFDDGASWSKLEHPPETELDMAFVIMGKPPSADLNRDGIVDFKDFEFFASQWLTSGP